jgi:hypothetical protein
VGFSRRRSNQSSITAVTPEVIRFRVRQVTNLFAFDRLIILMN